MSAHLESAARAAQSLLAARYPDQSWIVSVGERQGGDGHGEVSAPGLLDVGRPERYRFATPPTGADEQ